MIQISDLPFKFYSKLNVFFKTNFKKYFYTRIDGNLFSLPSLQSNNYLCLLILILLSSNCNHKIRTHLTALQNENKTISIYIEPVQVEIKIDNLRSISSRKVNTQSETQEIKYRSIEHARWFQLQLANYLEAENYQITKKEKADLIVKASIVDLSEIRPKMFIEGLSIGLVFGLIAGELSGDPQVGLGVFLLEIVEEFVILYILKSFFLVTTIQVEFKNYDGIILKDTEFTAYSNKEYIKKIPEQKQSIRENIVKASLDQNAQDIATYLKKQSILLPK